MMQDHRRSRILLDIVVYGTLGVLGVLQFVMIRNSADYLNDVNYYELAQSVIHGIAYGFNQKPMTQLPPGFPYLMAILSPLIGCSYGAMLHMMTICSTVALLLSYRLLRPQIGAVGAGIGCILIASSPSLFAFSTTLVFADMPYLLASVVLLLGAGYIDRVRQWTVWKRMGLVSWGGLLVAIVLIKSVALSLLLALVGWVGVSWLRNRDQGIRRMKLFLPFVLLAIVVECTWMYWAAAHQFHEWALPGYQEHYVAQLRLKDANSPELGFATIRDILVRPILHGDDIASAMFSVFSHKEMAPAWYSPGTVLPLLAILLGLAYSFRRGGSLLDWYFAIYQMMFLFWSWEFERRFFLAIAPLAIPYLWRSGQLIRRWTRRAPHLVGVVLLVMACGGCLSTVVWGRDVVHPQFRWCVVIWLSVGVAALLPFWIGIRDRLGHVGRRRPPVQLFGGTVWMRRALIGACTVIFVATGLSAEVRLGLVNRDPDLRKDDFNYPEIEGCAVDRGRERAGDRHHGA